MRLELGKRWDESHFCLLYHKVPLRDADDLKTRGCRTLKRGNTGVPMYTSVARFTCVVPLLLQLRRCCADAFEIQRKCGLEFVPRWHVFRMARPHNTHTRTHKSTVSQLSRNEYLGKYGYCYSVTATASKHHGVIQAHRSSTQHGKKLQEQ